MVKLQVFKSIFSLLNIKSTYIQLLHHLSLRYLSKLSVLFHLFAVFGSLLGQHVQNHLVVWYLVVFFVYKCVQVLENVAERTHPIFILALKVCLVPESDLFELSRRIVV